MTNPLADTSPRHALMFSMRDEALTNSDWTQMPDSPLTEEQKTSYATYRQALRDITSHANWPNLEESDWPVKPV